METWQIRNSEKSDICEILEKLFSKKIVLEKSFRFYPTAKIEFFGYLKYPNKISKIF